MFLLVLLTAFSCVGVSAQSTGGLKGQVVNEKGKPFLGVDVRVRSTRTGAIHQAVTDQAGVYKLDLEPDTYIVSFDAEGYMEGTLREMQQVEAGKETAVKPVRLQKATRTSLVRGAVFSSEGLSLPGARVKLERVPTEEEEKSRRRINLFTRNYTTNQRGEFAFRLPPERARYRVTAMASGYVPETRIIDVGEEDRVPVAFSLEPVKKQSIWRKQEEPACLSSVQGPE